MQYVHPGEIIKEEFLPAMKLSASEFAKRIFVSRTTAYRLLNGKQNISTDMAPRLGKLFGDEAGKTRRGGNASPVRRLIVNSVAAA